MAKLSTAGVVAMDSAAEVDHEHIELEVLRVRVGVGVGVNIGVGFQISNLECEDHEEALEELGTHFPHFLADMGLERPLHVSNEGEGQPCHEDAQDKIPKDSVVVHPGFQLPTVLVHLENPVKDGHLEKE